MNLRIATPADNQAVTIAADLITAQNDSLAGVYIQNASLTVSLDTAGANGLDNGSLAANTGYYLYVISNGTTPAGLASTSATAPTMPAGYTYYARVGWCTTDNTDAPFNVLEFTQNDDTYKYKESQIARVAVNTVANVTESMNLAAGGVKTYALIPPEIVKSIRLRVAFTAGNTLWNGETFPNTQNGRSTTYEAATYNATGTVDEMVDITILENQVVYLQTGTATTLEPHLVSFTLKR